MTPPSAFQQRGFALTSPPRPRVMRPARRAGTPRTEGCKRPSRRLQALRLPIVPPLHDHSGEDADIVRRLRPVIADVHHRTSEVPTCGRKTTTTLGARPREVYSGWFADVCACRDEWRRGRGRHRRADVSDLRLGLGLLGGDHLGQSRDTSPAPLNGRDSSARPVTRSRCRGRRRSGRPASRSPRTPNHDARRSFRGASPRRRR